MRFRLLVSTITLCCVRDLVAEEVAPKPVPPAEARPPILAPEGAVIPAARPRLPAPARTGGALSPEMARKLSEAVERVASPLAKRNASPVASKLPAGRSSDIVTLDPFVVNGDKEPRFKERQLLTPSERL